jgi:hypothetical protein
MIADRVFSALLCAVSIFIFYLSTQFEVGFIIDAGLGADFFPKLISCILFILSAILFIKSFRGIQEPSPFNKNVKNVLIAIVAIIAYLVLMNIIGYLIASILFLIVMFKFLKVHSNKLLIIYSILFATFIWYVFSNIFNINLPTGIFFY